MGPVGGGGGGGGPGGGGGRGIGAAAVYLPLGCHRSSLGLVDLNFVLGSGGECEGAWNLVPIVRALPTDYKF